MKPLATLAAIAITVAFGVTPYMLSAQTPQPYAGLQTRPIKALSEEQIGDLKAGRGMGLALAAELNGYPGPTHVLELAEPLMLSDAQRTAVRALFESMKAETVPLGEKMITQEAELNRQFAEKTVTEASLASATQAISVTQAALRTAHLKYHLATIKVLAPEQAQRYVELRGYANGQHSARDHGQHKR